jgi:hypothetical protein
VGAEFIIMEKVNGVPLVEKWDSMNTLERYKIIDQVIQTEKELANIVLPAYGGLFLRESLSSTTRQHPLPQDLDPDGLFCVGPSCRRTWWHDDSTNIIRQRPANVGPCKYSCDFATYGAEGGY